LKAIAEFVENSIDAHAKTITITRGKEHNAHYLSIRPNGLVMLKASEAELSSGRLGVDCYK
jgi:DNA mismatch repair ATPase MutL